MTSPKRATRVHSSHPHRSLIILTHDLIMAALSFVLALYLRLGDNIEFSRDLPYLGTALFTGVCAVVFLSTGLYRSVWRYASLPELILVAKSVTLAVAVFLPLLFFVNRLDGMPRSVMVITGLLLVTMLGGSRLVYRLVKERSLLSYLEGQAPVAQIPVILAGINPSAELFLREVSRPSAKYKVVAIVDKKARHQGGHIHGIKVHGGLANIPEVVANLRRKDIHPQRIVITEENLDGPTIRNLLEMANVLGLTLARLPRLGELHETLDGSLEVQPIAMEDLLGRPQMQLDRTAVSMLLQGKRVLVTGAGGTIGSELVRQIALYSPEHITLCELCEFNLYQIDKELEENHPQLSRTSLLSDVRNPAQMERMFAAERPDLVFHAAALKHVPLVEDNIEEAASANTLGTQCIADNCLKYGVEEMVLISTDKAVNPSSLMGATKRLAESYCQALGQSPENHHTVFSTVRFGNVLGSSGSVIPLFQRQLEQGGPLTITHPDMVRYFMTVREAVELVLQASALGLHQHNNRHSAIYVLDMGDPVRIEDLARQMIRMAGLRPDEDIQISYTGLRPGEKLFEELFHASEFPVPTECPGIMLATPRPVDIHFLRKHLQQLKSLAERGERKQIIALLKNTVPEYQRDSGVVVPFKPGKKKKVTA